MGAFIRDPRATTTELRKGAVKPEIERNPGNSQNVCGRKTTGELRWKKLDERKGKEITEEVWKTKPNRQRGKHKPKYKTIPKRYMSEENEPEMEQI